MWEGVQQNNTNLYCIRAYLFLLKRSRVSYFRPEGIFANFSHLTVLFFSVFIKIFFKRQCVVLPVAMNKLSTRLLYAACFAYEIIIKIQNIYAFCKFCENSSLKIFYNFFIEYWKCPLFGNKKKSLKILTTRNNLKSYNCHCHAAKNEYHFGYYSCPPLPLLNQANILYLSPFLLPPPIPFYFGFVSQCLSEFKILWHISSKSIFFPWMPFGHLMKFHTCFHFFFPMAFKRTRCS